jgi:2'-5' RNA ligase
VQHTESSKSSCGPSGPASVSLLRSHWQWRPEWAVDRACLLWYLTFESQPDLARQAEQVQACLGDVALVDVVPAPWLHLTVDDVGFADELVPGQVEQVVASARASVAGWAPPPITLGPLAPMDDSVVLAAGPVPELVDLHDRLRAATSGVLGAGAASCLDDFRPHVTLAYLNDACEPEAVMGPLGPVAASQVVVAGPRLTLASVTRRDRHYQWTSCAQLTLGASTASA